MEKPKITEYVKKDSNYHGYQKSYSIPLVNSGIYDDDEPIPVVKLEFDVGRYAIYPTIVLEDYSGYFDMTLNINMDAESLKEAIDALFSHIRNEDNMPQDNTQAENQEKTARCIAEMAWQAGCNYVVSEDKVHPVTLLANLEKLCRLNGIKVSLVSHYYNQGQNSKGFKTKEIIPEEYFK